MKKLKEEFAEMSKRTAVFLLIAGLLLGTVFTFGMRYWNAPVAREDAQHVTATFSSSKERLKHGRVQEIILCFDDHKELRIDGTCVSKALLEAIKLLEPGSVLEMAVHPNSNTILELQCAAAKYLDFEDAMKHLGRESAGFTVLGIFCYLSSIVGFARLILPRRKK